MAYESDEAVPFVPLVMNQTRHPMCDCGACCDQCGHDKGCMSQGGQ